MQRTQRPSCTSDGRLLEPLTMCPHSIYLDLRRGSYTANFTSGSKFILYTFGQGLVLLLQELKNADAAARGDGGGGSSP